MGTHPFDIFCTSTLFVKFGQSKVLVEVKSVGRCTEKVEDMKMIEVHKKSN